MDRGNGPRRRGGGRAGQGGNWRARNEGQAEGHDAPRFPWRGARGGAGAAGLNHPQRPRRDHDQDLHRNMGARRNIHERNRQEDNQTDRADNRQHSRNDRCMGFKLLEEIAHCTNQDVLAKVDQKSFQNLLNSNISTTEKGDFYVLIMEVISKVCESTFDELKSKVLLDICNSGFMINLRNYLSDLPYVQLKARNGLYWNNQDSFWNNFVAFCQYIVDMSPSTALLKCRSLIEGSSRSCLEDLRDKHGFAAADEFNEKLKPLRERLTLREQEETDKKETSQKGYINLNEGMDPPEDFRQLSVLPTREDLLHRETFLRPNIVNGGYQNTEHYLDVQFRLLREDCIGPLRDGIAQFIQNPDKRKYDNIRVYHNVKFIEPYISKNKIGTTVQLDEKAMRRFKRINWSHSKRFIFGSLVLFTKDNCGSFITATILERDEKLLNQGKIPISVIGKAAGDNIYNDDSSYIMIESEVYFEPYFHVLEALKDPKFPEHLAMDKYIVRVDPVPNPPAYLTEDSKYEVDSKNGVIDTLSFNVLNERTWPTKDDLGLNETQYEAYKLALTHEFAVIQGPPGTGKTYLGVKVAKTLLENPIMKDEGCLMLVICYTNHALDQFLEAIQPITNNIVRIGGQSRNEAMEKISLASLRKKKRANNYTMRFFHEKKDDLTSAVYALKRSQERLDSFDNGVISFDSLKDCVPEVQSLGQYYAQYRNNIRTDPLLHWLFEHMVYTDINNVINEENIENRITEEANINNDIDDDHDRTEIILDEFGDEDEEREDDEEREIIELPGSLHINTSFSLADTQNKLKRQILLYNKSNSHMQQQLLPEIVHLKSRADFFIAMQQNRNRQTRLRIHDRMDAGNVPTADRWIMYFRWANVVINRFKRRMKPLQDKLDSANTAYEEARMLVDLDILDDVEVVGMTTSGAARLRKLLKALAPPIVIVEEAAEVLEQHIVTSLTKDCKHLILIGDHQQLRPSAAHMRLAQHFNIEISLFERMINNGIHSRRLGVQHRMRPEIAALISPHIYPDLRNHASVEYFPNVRGMTDNLFFFSHDNKEEEVDDSASKSNQLEADMTLKLANYLMQQGYDPTDITILAAYSGQMFYMRKQREKYAFLQKVKITVVDNYQGEESKIILLSLVRNNDQNKIGFLGTENRVCVALSRAREGFYILGNIDILKKNSELWSKIAITLESRGSLGTALMLKCENHPEQINTISSPKDFEKVPEGGCLSKCNYELPCGHVCKLMCHGYDRGHLNVQCFAKCERILCELGHVCPLLCLKKCEACKVKVPKKLPCGHTMSVECHENPEDVKCLTIVEERLPLCGHMTKKACYQDIRKVKCQVPCINRVEKCGHECVKTCHVDDDADHEEYICDKPCAKAKNGCTANLIGDRGNHQCTRKCYEVCEDCTVEVKKKRTKCTHSERVPCNKNVDDAPCRKKCAKMIIECGHHCKKKCHEPCGDCMQIVKKVIPDCNHEIKVPCKTPATRDLCKRKCERKLDCGHMCTQDCSAVCDAKKCNQLISKKLQSPCGHEVQLPCNVYHLMLTAWSDAVLLEHCTAACGETLACGHMCGGSCGACLQGRIHLACVESCNLTDVCGHVCNEPCNRACPPCNKKCEIRCPHSRCNKVCGAPCKPCQEKCKRKCSHGACTRRCGEPCSRAPCDEPCPLVQPCGHRCRGLCGEPCPNVCDICRPEEFPKDYFNLGDEYDEDEKLIRLEDCQHILDVNNMDRHMMIDSEKGKVDMKKCPICRKPITNTPRYKDLVSFKIKTEINPLKKEKLYGNEDLIKSKRGELLNKILSFYKEKNDAIQGNSAYRGALSEISKVVKTERNVSLPKLDTQFKYLEILDMIGESFCKYRKDGGKNLENEFDKFMSLLCTKLIANLHKISQQMQQDFSNELKRMSSIVQFAKILNHPSYMPSKENPAVKQATDAAMNIVFSWSKFDQNKTELVLKELEKAVKVSGIVTKEERDLIVKAIGLKAGSWYKCPNGHYYAIGECGGAMQVSKCADCGTDIGGQNHRLLPTNAHAGELDGSPFAAWSQEYNNMANWRF